jgi:hypothetical protein
MVDREDDRLRPPPAIGTPAGYAIEERKGISAAGNGERDQGSFGKRREKRLEFFVGEWRRASNSHWLVRS